MKKYYLVGVATATMLTVANANAEFIVGGDVGVASITATAKGSANDRGASGSSLGVFGRYMFAPQSSDGGFGVHVGYADHSADIATACANDFSEKCAQLNLENTIAVLGVSRTAEFGDGWSGVLMAGYSRLKAEFEFEDGTRFAGPDDMFNTNDDIQVGGLKDSATHGGYKLAAGVQKVFGENASMQASVQYADYGRETYKFVEGIESKIDLKTLGFRIGVAYHF